MRIEATRAPLCLRAPATSSTLGVDGAHHDGGTFIGKALGHRRADAAARAGHHRYLALKALMHLPISYQQTKPPSTMRSMPVTKLEARLARKTAGPTISSGVGHATHRRVALEYLDLVGHFGPPVHRRRV